MDIMLNVQEPGQDQVDLLQLAKQLADVPARQPVTNVLEGRTLQRRQIMKYGNLYHYVYHFAAHK